MGGSKVSPSGELIMQYLNKYRSAPSQTLARMIYNAHSDIFTSQDTVRNRIRYYRGTHGNEHRGKLDQETYTPLVNVPEGQKIDFSPYVIGEDAFPILIGSDVHIPYHEQDAMEIFIERAAAMQPKTIILDGDWLDMYMCSAFIKDPSMWQPVQEFEMFGDIMRILHDASPKSKVIYKIGNHEERFDDYIIRNASALWGLDGFNFAGAVKKYADFDIEIIDHKRIIRALDISIIHGHEWKSSFFSPVNPARGLFLRAKDTTIGGHHHQSSHHKEPTIRGKSVQCWSMGCLCDLHPQYMPLNKWNHGFCEITYDGDLWRVQNREIVNYRLV